MKTKSGRLLTNNDLETLADGAEAGYDPARLKARVVAKPARVSRPAERAVIKSKARVIAAEAATAGRKRRNRASR